jgi:hypothetical protein
MSQFRTQTADLHPLVTQFRFAVGAGQLPLVMCLHRTASALPNPSCETLPQYSGPTPKADRLLLETPSCIAFALTSSSPISLSLLQQLAKDTPCAGKVSASRKGFGGMFKFRLDLGREKAYKG